MPVYFYVFTLELQGQLADYNLVVDKVNTDTEKGEVDAECKELKEQNDQAMAELEQLLSQRQQKEAQIRQLEKEIEQVFHYMCFMPCVSECVRYDLL
jgi:predicted  nucleic acid-binding Zn-ribbon protein